MNHVNVIAGFRAETHYYILLVPVAVGLTLVDFIVRDSSIFMAVGLVYITKFT